MHTSYSLKVNNTSLPKYFSISNVLIKRPTRTSATSIACDENKNVAPQIQQQESCRISETITMGMPVPIDPLQLNSNSLPIIVGDAPQGEEPTRYNPAFPEKGFYKKK
ncbi:MAG TPA: hypothetical protein DGG95_07810 [Cytophagales bacterium]|nr:hypothetical protein [Cytophagales bacterium]